MEATWVSINGGMDKEEVVHIYNGILLGHKKEQNLATCNNMDGPRGYCAEWSKLEKDKCHLWNLENRINKQQN